MNIISLLPSFSVFIFFLVFFLFFLPFSLFQCTWVAGVRAYVVPVASSTMGWHCIALNVFFPLTTLRCIFSVAVL